MYIYMHMYIYNPVEFRFERWRRAGMRRVVLSSVFVISTWSRVCITLSHKDTLSLPYYLSLALSLSQTHSLVTSLNSKGCVTKFVTRRALTSISWMQVDF